MKKAVKFSTFEIKKMTIEARKLSFIQEFLLLQNEEILISLENLLHKYKSEANHTDFPSISMEEFNADIDQSILDAKNGDYISAEDLRLKVKGWS